MPYANCTPVVLFCAALAACSPGEDALEAKTAAQGNATPAMTDAQAAAEPAGRIDETASAYMARRNPQEEIQPGEVQAEAVGAITSCAVCHGPAGGGNEKLGTPRIGGMPEWYLARQLKYFKAGLRGATDANPHGMQMRAITLPLSGQAIEDLAAHLASMSPPAAPPLTSGDTTRGARLYAVCTACHGPAARGNPQLDSPGLVRQSGSYLVRQLEHYRTGLRGADPADKFGQQMLPIVKSTLTSRQDAVDVVSYIATLRDGTGSKPAR